MVKVIKLNKKKIDLQDIFENHQELLELTSKLCLNENIMDKEIADKINSYYEKLNILYNDLFDIGINMEFYNKV
jgi:hypothetical protein